MALFFQNRQRTVAIQTARVRRQVERIMAYLQCPDAELSVVFLSDQRMRDLNRLYRQKDRPTNVLAFPQQDAPQGPDTTAVLGDVVVALPTAAREAQVLRQALEDRVVYLILHGLLHLLGYDHERSVADRRRMTALETKVLQHLRGESPHGT